MFAYLCGKLAEKHPTMVIVDCAGVGYELSIPVSTYEKLPQRGETVHLEVLYQFNETDGAKLFGFGSKQEKELFRLLLSVSKVGPRTAIAVLSTLSVEEFQRAVLETNLKLIATVPGIGKKSAERLVLELKDKLKSSSTSELPSLGASITGDASAALETLGFSQNEIGKCFSRISKDKSYTSAEELIKDALKQLHKK